MTRRRPDALRPDRRAAAPPRRAPDRLRLLTWICVGLLASAVLHAGEEGEDVHPLDLARRIREDKPLDREEEAYLDRLRRRRGLDREEAATFIEESWRELERREGAAAHTPHRDDAAPPPVPRRPTGTAWVLGIASALGLALIVAILFLRNWLRERRISRALRSGSRSGDLLRTESERDDDA
jgi:hypothetical protein